MALTYQRLKAEQFAFRVMKEVRNYVKNGGRLAEARDGMVITLAFICDVPEEEVVDALRSRHFVDTRTPSGNRRSGPK